MNENLTAQFTFGRKLKVNRIKKNILELNEYNNFEYNRAVNLLINMVISVC